MSSIYFTSLDHAALVPSLMLQSCFPEQKRGLSMGNGSSPQVLAVPAVVRARGRWLKNVEFAMGNGRWETGNYGSSCTVPGCGTGLCRMVCKRWS